MLHLSTDRARVIMLAIVIASCSRRSEEPETTSGEAAPLVPAALVPEPPKPSPSEPVAPTAPACAADASWITAPNPPDEIPNAGETLCDFYQFSWQWFLALVSPVQGGSRRFQVSTEFPVLDPSIDSCTQQPSQPVLFVRTRKSVEDDDVLVLPEEIQQAGSGATIFDQGGNVVFYEVQFNRTLCDAQPTGDLPAGTTELKTAWRVLTSTDDANRYFTMTAEIEGVGTKQLGLVGFHLVRSTALHPEFVWATWEHVDNVPDCEQPAANPSWSFTSQACAACLAKDPNDCDQCNFNTGSTQTSLTGPPTEICRTYPDGSKPGDDKYAENVADIDALNQQIIGPNGFLTLLPVTDPMAVFRYYENVGALWESNVTQPSSDVANQRGSIQLANTVMETTFQDLGGTAVNCFGCHGYTPGKTAETPSISHIFDDIHGSTKTK